MVLIDLAALRTVGIQSGLDQRTGQLVSGCSSHLYRYSM
jgi:hypothetical protein